jgi:hypothetical protein
MNEKRKHMNNALRNEEKGETILPPGDDGQIRRAQTPGACGRIHTPADAHMT